MKKIDIIVDLQFGSCGKGLLAGYLAEHNRPDTIVTAWAPNAGHTYINGEGRKFINVALPNGIVSPHLRRVMLGPGSVINPNLLMVELDAYGDLLQGVDVVIHEHAAIVAEEHRMMESVGMVGIGSTMKGVGEATIEKIRRKVGAPNIVYNALKGTPLEGMVVDRFTYAAMLEDAEVMQIEGAQGFSLGINSGFYPYTTSRECTVSQLLSDCAVPISVLRDCCSMYDSTIWGACRTFPIRVANRYDKGTGVQIGWSGPCYPDQQEITFEEIGQPVELTTVTRLPRRIFTFSDQQVLDACRMNSVDKIFLNFTNYLPPNTVDDFVHRVETNTGVSVVLMGAGPTVNDIIELGEI